MRNLPIFFKEINAVKHGIWFKSEIRGTRLDYLDVWIGINEW